MSEENKAVVRTYLRAWEQGDVALMESVVAPGFTHTMLGREEDRAGLLERVASMNEIYSDVSYGIDELVAEGDRVACRWRMTMRHTGLLPLGPIGQVVGRDSLEPTGRVFEHTGLFVAIVRDGQLVGGWGEYDRLGLLTRMGAFLQATGAGDTRES